ncbi:MAG TPA: glycosyltransferase family 2 protein, partial [Actinomycetales bacterium]
MPAEPTSLAVVVVHYKGVELTLECVRSLPPLLPVAVVDNSGDLEVLRAGLADQPQVAVLGEGRNLGFGQAANLGAAALDAEVLLLVNPDARPSHQDLEALLGLLRRRPDVVGVAPALVDEEGAVHNDGGGWLPTPARALAHSVLSGRAGTRGVWLRPDRPRTYDVEWLTGACALVRADAFAAVGGFAPEFVLYNEDMDLGRRLVERGG